MEEKEIFYLCDGDKECCSSHGCFMNGGECRHTKDIRHAISFLHVADTNFYDGEGLVKKKEAYTERNWISEIAQNKYKLLNELLEEEKKHNRVYRRFCYFYIGFVCVWIVLMIIKIFI